MVIVKWSYFNHKANYDLKGVALTPFFLLGYGLHILRLAAQLIKYRIISSYTLSLLITCTSIFHQHIYPFCHSPPPKGYIMFYTLYMLNRHRERESEREKTQIPRFKWISERCVLDLPWHGESDSDKMEGIRGASRISGRDLPVLLHASPANNSFLFSLQTTSDMYVGLQKISVTSCN